MTDPTPLDDYGVLTEPATLVIQRLLPGPADRVWAYLTNSNMRRQWLAAGEMEMKVGAPFELVWRNGDLSSRPSQRPSGFSEEKRMWSRITEIEPQRRISFTWDGTGDVTFELKPQGNAVLLIITHRRVTDRVTLLKVSAGWHMHLDVLVARVRGEEPEPFWEGWSRLQQDYDRRLPG
jgi:uncharacterized protein YndB with AHSA1/START domain